MSENTNNAVSLALTRDMIYGAATPRNLIELPAVKDNWVKQYSLVTGNVDGELRYEAERVMFMQKIAESDALQKCDLMTIYAAWVELGVSGLSLRDGMSYILPYKGKAEWQPGWKGRLEQISQLPHVNYVDEPILVYNCDKFIYTRGEETRIKEHTPKYPRPAGAEIHFVYLTITLASGAVKVHLMDRDEVLSIRDQYSESYKGYLRKVAEGKWQDWMDGGIWLKNEPQAFRKTLVKRVYNNGQKLPHHKYLDQRLKEREVNGGAQFDDLPETNDFSSAFAMADDGKAVVETSTGEVIGQVAQTEDITHEEVKDDAPGVAQPEPSANNAAGPPPGYEDVKIPDYAGQQAAEPAQTTPEATEQPKGKDLASQVAIDSMIVKIKAGEPGVITKAQEFFDLTEEQLAQLRNAIPMMESNPAGMVKQQDQAQTTIQPDPAAQVKPEDLGFDIPDEGGF